MSTNLSGSRYWYFAFFCLSCYKQAEFCFTIPKSCDNSPTFLCGCYRQSMNTKCQMKSLCTALLIFVNWQESFKTLFSKALHRKPEHALSLMSSSWKSPGAAEAQKTFPDVWAPFAFQAFPCGTQQSHLPRSPSTRTWATPAFRSHMWADVTLPILGPILGKAEAILNFTSEPNST